MLFNKTRDHYNDDLQFYLCVWKDEGGLPGDLIYISPGTFSPGDETGMPGFRRYFFPADTDLVISDTSFFAGWKQVTEDFLNLGYDVNRNNLDRTFVNSSGEWFNPGRSLIPGALMIRTVFGASGQATGITELPEKNRQVLLFPNPASEKIHIKATGFTIDRIRLFDIHGRVLLDKTGTSQDIDVTSLRQGLYIIQLTAADGTNIFSKMVIRH
jgi:hypothetical protein